MPVESQEKPVVRAGSTRPPPETLCQANLMDTVNSRQGNLRLLTKRTKSVSLEYPENWFQNESECPGELKGDNSQSRNNIGRDRSDKPSIEGKSVGSRA